MKLKTFQQLIPSAEDIGPHDHVEDDAVLPQLEHQQVSSPMLTHSKLISIGRPLTPIAQDASWADRPQAQEEEDFEAQPTPTPQASPALRRLRKGPRPPVSESENTAEDIPAASADEEEAPVPLRSGSRGERDCDRPSSSSSGG